MRAAKVLDGDRPVMVISFRTQQMTLIRDAKSGDIVQGDAEKLEKFGYQWALTLDEGAWKIVEMTVQAVSKNCKS